MSAIPAFDPAIYTGTQANSANAANTAGIANDGLFQSMIAQADAQTKTDGSADTLAPLGPAKSLSKDDQAKVKAKIAKAAQDFETMYLGQMLEPMFSGLKTDGPMGGGHAEDTWRSFLVQEYAKSITKAGGLGISKMVEGQLLDAAGLAPKTIIHPKDMTGVQTFSAPDDVKSTAPKPLPLTASLADKTKLGLPISETKR